MYRHDSRYAALEGFVAALHRGGVAHGCVSPGARSTPLALTLAAHHGLRVWSHIDERSGAFFALGIAKASQQPVAIVCTSGTAAANFLPAIVEAAYAQVPLIVLTADRPPELRDCGAAQTIDQIKLYGAQVKWFAEVGTADAGEPYFRSLGAQAAATAVAVPAGPVHLNFPFREPLMPEPVPAGEIAGSRDAAPAGERFAVAHPVLPHPSARTVDELAAWLGSAPRGLIVCGPCPTGFTCAPAIVRLAATLGYPVLADPTSQVRCGPHDRTLVLDAYDALLRGDAFADRMVPDVVLRFGPLPASKTLLGYLRCHPTARHIVIDPHARWNDPARMATDVIACDPAVLCEAWCRALGTSPERRREVSAWRTGWIDADRRARAAIAERLERTAELFEGRAWAELAALVPDGACLYVGNSMPVRDLDSFWPASARAVRVLCNRGASGIDGFASSALGAAAVSAGPLIAVTGDLGFYHDLNGLLAARRYGLRATIIVFNNDGGGIFAFLPQAQCGADVEDVFFTPHGLDFRGAVEMYGCAFDRVASWEQFRDAVARALGAEGTTVIEVPVDRRRNVALHREMWAAAAAIGEGTR